MKEKFFTAPNIITLFRLILVPVYAAVYFALPHMRWLALLCFLVACLSDVVDGYIARKYNLISKIGTVLDPLADKLMYITVVCGLVISGTINFWFFLIYAVKELVMIVGAAVMIKEIKEVIPAKWYGKLSTALFFVVISVPIVYPSNWDTLWINLAYLAVLLLAIYAFVRYGLIYLSLYKKNSEAKSEASKEK